MQKKGQSFEYMRHYAHLRLRTNTFGAVMRIRHNMAMAIHTYFHEHGYFYFNTPLITASDCEGAGQMFQVTTKNLYNLKKTEDGKIDYSDDFFGKQTSLTVSGQLRVSSVLQHSAPSIPSVQPSVQRTVILLATWLSSGW